MADENPNNPNPALPPRPVHGSIRPSELRALGLKPEDVLDFSASISPIGPPDGVWDAMRQVDLSTYPDPECLELTETISRHLSRPGMDVPNERIIVGNGSSEIFHLLARAYLTPEEPATALLMTPTYGEYAGACRLTGANIATVEAAPEKGFRWDLEEAASRISALRPRFTILCNPNNPTGVYLRESEVAGLADAAALSGGLLVVDEAYLSFVRSAWDSLGLLQRDNVVLVRSMTKDYAQTGLRLGYALAPEPVVSRLRAYQPDWSVNSLAQKAGIAALNDTDYLPRAREAVFTSKDFLIDKLTALGLEVPASEANFLLVKVGDAASWRAGLLKQGIVVRDCTSFGLPQYIRIGIRKLEDCQRLAATVEFVAASIGRS